MALQSFTKQPAEQYKIAVEFSGKLPSGATLASGEVTARKTSDNSDASATVLVSTSAEISGTQARVVVRAGTANENYKVTFVITLNDGSILEEDILMQVVDN